MTLPTGKGRTVGQGIRDIIDYTENPQKTDGGRLITSWQCDSRIAEFLVTQNQHIQKTGSVRGEEDVIAYHLRQSFVPGEITPEEANRSGCELAKRFTKGNHAYIVCTHIDKAHIRNHVIWNSTALSQTRKFRNFGAAAAPCGSSTIDNLVFFMYNRRCALDNAHRTMQFVMKGCGIWLRKTNSQRKKW